MIQSDILKVNLTNEILTLPDGDQVSVEWAQGTQPYTLSLYHGLGGNSQADYIQRSALIANELGWNIVLVNHRGADARAIAVKSYHSGRGDDADFIIKWCRQKFINSKQIALGFSMSGSILLNLLAKRFGSEQPDVGIIVNAPLDLSKAAWQLTKGFNRIYDVRFFLILKKIISEKSDIHLPLIGRTLDLDQLYTAPVNSFKDRDDYYEKCSTKNVVGRIETQTFILSSEDDPFIDVNDYKTAKWNKNIHLTLSPFGGHMGYFSKEVDPKYGHRWLDRYLRSVFDKIQII
jgi:predicted alpha/beta-fold hydrolase